jgi:hypothetical protein
MKFWNACFALPALQSLHWIFGKIDTNHNRTAMSRVSRGKISTVFRAQIAPHVNVKLLRLWALKIAAPR